MAASNALNLSEDVQVEGSAVPSASSRRVIINVEDDELEVTVGDTTGSPLRDFLASSMLSTDNETQDAKDDKSTPKVTISTCHAAKGLEWPVVFLPAGMWMFHQNNMDRRAADYPCMSTQPKQGSIQLSASQMRQK